MWNLDYWNHCQSLATANRTKTANGTRSVTRANSTSRTIAEARIGATGTIAANRTKITNRPRSITRANSASRTISTCSSRNGESKTHHQDDEQKYDFFHDLFSLIFMTFDIQQGYGQK